MPAEMLQNQTVEPLEHSTPGGRMAELIEMSDPPRPSPYTGQAPQTYAGYQTQPSLAPTLKPTLVPVARPVDGSMPEWWNRS